MEPVEKSRMHEFCANCPCFHIEFTRDNSIPDIYGFVNFLVRGNCSFSRNAFSIMGGVRRVIVDKKELEKAFYMDADKIEKIDSRFEELPECMKPYVNAYVKSYSDCVAKNSRDCRFYMERSMEDWNK